MDKVYEKEISKLAKLLDDANIPYEENFLHDGLQINYPSKQNAISDVVCHEYSYGGKRGLLEQMGLVGEIEDDVEGYLTAEEVFQCWSEHWKQNHSTLRP